MDATDKEEGMVLWIYPMELLVYLIFRTSVCFLYPLPLIISYTAVGKIRPYYYKHGTKQYLKMQ